MWNASEVNPINIDDIYKQVASEASRKLAISTQICFTKIKIHMVRLENFENKIAIWKCNKIFSGRKVLSGSGGKGQTNIILILALHKMFFRYFRL